MMMGPTTNEAEKRVMDLWDGGMSIQKIARHLGRSRGYASEIISRFAPTESDRRESRAAITQASARLLAALRQYHPERTRG